MAEMLTCVTCGQPRASGVPCLRCPLPAASSSPAGGEAPTRWVVEGRDPGSEQWHAYGTTGDEDEARRWVDELNRHPFNKSEHRYRPATPASVLPVEAPEGEDAYLARIPEGWTLLKTRRSLARWWMEADRLAAALAASEAARVAAEAATFHFAGQRVRLVATDHTAAGFGVTIYLDYAGMSLPLGNGPTLADALNSIPTRSQLTASRRQLQAVQQAVEAWRVSRSTQTLDGTGSTREWVRAYREFERAMDAVAGLTPASPSTEATE